MGGSEESERSLISSEQANRSMTKKQDRDRVMAGIAIYHA